MGIIFGPLAALGWAAGDFVIGRATGAIGPLATLSYVQIAGIGANDRVLLARADAHSARPGLWAGVLLASV